MKTGVSLKATVSVLGLALDFVGVVIVGFLAEQWLEETFAGDRRFRRPWQQIVYRVGWGLIATGFVVQAVAQVL